MSDVEEMHAELMNYIQRILSGETDLLDRFGEAPVDFVDAYAGDDAGTVDPAALVAEALAGTDLDPATQAAVLEAVNASAGGYAPADGGGYTSEQLADIFAQGINITVEEGDEIYVDNSLYVDGDVKGGIHQNNVTDITQADDGAIIADGAQNSNFQTGQDNVQISDSHVENVTTGDGNTVASGGSVIGNENVSADYISDSEFGEGDQDRSTDADIKLEGSVTDDDVDKSTYSDDDVREFKADVDANLDQAYGEPAPYVEAPKPVYEAEEPVDPEGGYEQPKPVYEAEEKPVFEEPTYEPEPATYVEPEPEVTYDDPEPEGYDCD